jgi:hypothetical protein
VEEQFNASVNSNVDFGTNVPAPELDKIAPLIRIVCWNKSVLVIFLAQFQSVPFAFGVVLNKPILPDPALYPSTVIRSGSPPNAPIFSLIHFNAAI